jgi:hypothetical protein
MESNRTTGILWDEWNRIERLESYVTTGILWDDWNLMGRLESWEKNQFSVILIIVIK